jgi:hypothetical protein
MEPRKPQVGFILRHVKTEQFAIIEENCKHTHGGNLTTRLNFGLDDKNRMVEARVLFRFEEEPGMFFLIIEAACHFEVKEETWNSLLRKDEKKIILPCGFAQHLLVLTIGTVRGILHAKTEGTAFNQYVLPTINVAEMLKEDVKFRIGESDVDEV